ncbi:hypothetical protein P8452_26711 [Trifolium repens]|nr:hypothetical protein P8452_26711 [Trifolium repens]
MPLSSEISDILVLENPLMLVGPLCIFNDHQTHHSLLTHQNTPELFWSAIIKLGNLMQLPSKGKGRENKGNLKQDKNNFPHAPFPCQRISSPFFEGMYQFCTTSQCTTDEGIQSLQQPSRSYRACGKGHNPREPDVAQFQSSQGLKMH